MACLVLYAHYVLQLAGNWPFKSAKMAQLSFAIMGVYIPIWVFIFAIWELCNRAIARITLVLAFIPALQPYLGSEY